MRQRRRRLDLRLSRPSQIFNFRATV